MQSGKPPVPLTDQDIREILKLLDESRFDEMRLEIPGLKLVISKGAVQSESDARLDGPFPTPPQAGAMEVPIPPPEPPPVHEFPAPSPAPAPGAPAPGARHPAAQPPSTASGPRQDGLVPITAPILGVFYRASEPGAPPFVKVGSTVGEGTTVCLLEVMKLFNSVKAGVTGRVAQVCAENGKMVEFGETLFLVEPGPGPGKKNPGSAPKAG